MVPPDLWLDGDTDFRLGGAEFRLLYSGGAHSPEDMLMYVVEDRVLYAGDLIFAGRIPFVGNADSRGWLAAMGKMLALSPAPVVVIPGHGAASRDRRTRPRADPRLPRLPAQSMGRAVRELEPFDAAYAETDWGRFKALPAFEQANRTQRLWNVPAARGRGTQGHQTLIARARANRPAVSLRRASVAAPYRPTTFDSAGLPRATGGSQAIASKVTTAMPAISSSKVPKPAALTSGPSSQTAAELTLNETARRMPLTRDRMRSST